MSNRAPNIPQTSNRKLIRELEDLRQILRSGLSNAIEALEEAEPSEERPATVRNYKPRVAREGVLLHCWSGDVQTFAKDVVAMRAEYGTLEGVVAVFNDHYITVPSNIDASALATRFMDRT
jgi:hypothetical protein